MAARMSDAELAALKKAYSTGAEKVKYADREVTYRSLEEMEKMIADEEAARAADKPASRLIVTPRSGFSTRGGF